MGCRTADIGDDCSPARQPRTGTALRRLSRRRSIRPRPLPRGSARTISSAPQRAASLAMAPAGSDAGAPSTLNSTRSWLPSASAARERSSRARSRLMRFQSTDRVSQQPVRGVSSRASTTTVMRASRSLRDSSAASAVALARYRTSACSRRSPIDPIVQSPVARYEQRAGREEPVKIPTPQSNNVAWQPAAPVSMLVIPLGALPSAVSPGLPR